MLSGSPFGFASKLFPTRVSAVSGYLSLSSPMSSMPTEPAPTTAMLLLCDIFLYISLILSMMPVALFSLKVLRDDPTAMTN